MNLVTEWVDTKTIYGACLRENMRRLQNISATKTPNCEDARAVKLVGTKTWLCSVCVWMAKNNIQIKGTPELQGGVTNDIAIVDLGIDQEERKKLRSGCHRFGVFWISQIGYTDGPETVTATFKGGPFARSSWAQLIRARIQQHRGHLPSDSDRAAPGTVMQGDVVIMSDIDPLCTSTITLARVTRHDSTTTCIIPVSYTHLRAHAT